MSTIALVENLHFALSDGWSLGGEQDNGGQGRDNKPVQQSHHIIGRRPNLHQLTRSHEVNNYACHKEGFLPFGDKILHNRTSLYYSRKADRSFWRGDTRYQIPLVLHQTSKSRCLPRGFRDYASKWKNLEGFEYYFHDDRAVDELLYAYTRTEFPHLSMVTRNCLNSGATKADVWRLLLLYEYGGVYADFDSIPTGFSLDTLKPDDEAFMVVDKDNLPSQFFMAFRPKHPLLFLTLHVAMSSLLKVDDTGAYNPVAKTGPAALRGGIYQFLGGTTDGDYDNQPYDSRRNLRAGVYRSRLNATMRLFGHALNPDTILNRFPRTIPKNDLYVEMNMTHFTDVFRNKTGIPCEEAILMDTMKLEQEHPELYLE